MHTERATPLRSRQCLPVTIETTRKLVSALFPGIKHVYFSQRSSRNDGCSTFTRRSWIIYSKSRKDVIAWNRKSEVRSLNISSKSDVNTLLKFSYMSVILIYRLMSCLFSLRWFRQHEFIEKLNMQAILNAQSSQEEFVKDLFVSLGKVIYCLSKK